MSDTKQLGSGPVQVPFEALDPTVPLDPYGKKRGYQSWQQTIRRISQMTPAEVQATYAEAVTDLSRYGNITLRELAILRAFQEVIEHPNPAMLSLIMERDEGKVPQTNISASGNISDWMEYAKQENIPIEDVMREARKIMDEYEKAPEVVEGEIVE